MKVVKRSGFVQQAGLILPLHQSGENKDKIFSIQSSDVCG